MNRRRNISVAMLLTFLTLVAGCRVNPAVREKKYLDSGRRYSAEGKYKEATIQFLNALKVDEDFPDAHYELAKVYEHTGQFESALQELQRTIDAQPENLAARLDLANLMLASGGLSSAQQLANAVLAADVNNSGVHALLSAIAARQDQYDKAVAEIKRAIELEPNRAAYHDNLGLLLANDTTTAQLAETEFRRAIQLDLGSANARLLLASYYVRNDRLVEAEKIAWEAVGADRRSLTARADVAQIILKEGDWARAVQVLRQASQDLSDTAQGASILADYYASTQQYGKARAEFTAQLAKYPKNTILQKGYVRILIQTRDYAAAKTSLALLVKNNPKDPEAAALNGILLLNDGNVDEATNELRDGARFLPEDAFIQYWLGKAAQAKGEINVAEISFRQALEFDPYAEEALKELARIASQRGDTALLEDVADRTISALPEIPDGYIWRSIVEMNRGSLDQAESDLQSAIKVAPQSWQAYLQFGKLRFLQKRFPEGSALLEQALEYNPNSIQALHLLTDYDLFANHPEKALARVNAQIQKNPRNSSLYDLLAQLQVQNGKFDEAAQTAQHAIQLNTSDGEAVSIFAEIAVDRGMTPQAIDAWLQWSNTHSNDAGALAVLGALEESRGNLDTAEAYYKRSLQIQPRQPIAANNLAYRMLQHDEEIDLALTLAETARQAMPDSPNTADTLAWAYYHKGTYQFARDLLEDAINMEPDSASMQYHLGMVYSKLNDKRSAMAHLKKALSLAHDSQTSNDAKLALRELGSVALGKFFATSYYVVARSAVKDVQEVN